MAPIVTCGGGDLTAFRTFVVRSHDEGGTNGSPPR
jgi:hypothetical protein